MKSNLNHLQINIDYQNINFYRNLLRFLGWKIIFEDQNIVGFSSGTNGSLWFVQRQKDFAPDRDGNGVNHIGIGTGSIASVDETVKYLKNNNIALLFDTPRHRPDFSSPKETYYQVMFESPDKILFEVFYTGPK